MTRTLHDVMETGLSQEAHLDVQVESHIEAG